MKQKILLLSTLVLYLGVANAQWTNPTTSWTYGFSAGSTSNYTTLGEFNLSPKPTGALYNSFLPAPPTDTSYVYIKAGSLGEYTLNPVPNTLKMVAGSNTSKFGAFGLTGATSVAHFSITITLDSASGVVPTNGTIYQLAIGNSSLPGSILGNTGAISNNSSIAHNSIFTILRILYSTTAPNHYTLSFRDTALATGAPAPVAVNPTLGGGSLYGNIPYTIDLYCNDSTADQNYTGPDHNLYTVPADSFHIWVTDGTTNTMKRYSLAGDFNLGRSFESSSTVRPVTTGADLSIAPNTALNSFFLVSGGGTNQSGYAIINGGMSVSWAGILSAAPVSFISNSFTGQLVGKSVQLNWETASEQNNAWFEVLRSGDANTFTSIGEVPGNLTTSLKHKYSFADDNPFSGINYYKLKQVDIDGKGTYTNTIAVNDAAQQQNTFKVYVSGNQLNAIANVATAGNAALQVFSASGQQIINTQEQLIQGENHFTIDVSSLQAGVYIAVINNNGKEQSVKFIR
jgi:hypothetical protein